jgi:capsular polysaccharide biosynthesis protein
MVSDKNPGRRGDCYRFGRLIVPSPQEILAGPNVERLEAPDVWIRPAADFVVDLSGAQLPHYLSEPQGNRRHGSYRNRYEDVLVFGCHHFNGLLDEAGRIACQEIDGMPERLNTHVHHHPGRDAPIPQIYPTTDGFRVDCGAVSPERLEGSLYLGTPIEPLNWGMWLLQVIPSAIDYLECVSAGRFFAYIERDWQRRLLNTLGIPDEKLIHHELVRTYDCEDLVLKQYSEIDLIPTPMEREIFARVAREIAGVEQQGGRRRLFLSRRSVTSASAGTYRALLNEDELVDAFDRRGYEIVEPELLSFADQIRLFSEAELVVGLGGAAMFNVIFSPPATRVVTIESSAAFVHAHACLFGALEHPYGVIFGRQDPEDETPVQKRWTIDVNGVMRALDRYE